MTSQSSPIRGIFVPTVVPFTQSGQLNEDELARYLDWLLSRGIHGLYPNGSTGEFTRLNPAERRRIVQISSQVAAGRGMVLAGAAEENALETLRACELYGTYGVRAAAIVSPYYYKLSPEAVFAYFREIVTHSPIDVVLYNIPMFATPLDLDTIRRLAEFDRVVGIKDSSGDVSFVLRVIDKVRPSRPDFAILSGWDPTLVSLLMMGIDGATLATAGVAPELLSALYNLSNQGEWALARELQFRLLRLFDSMISASDFPGGFRAGVQLRGFDIGTSRQPLCDASDAARSTIRNELDAVLNHLSVSTKL
jgi:4-hydroxy-tetrahydrodipicolinate synthase